MVTDMTAISEQTMESLAAGALSEQEVGDIVALGSEAAVLVIPERSRQLAEQRAETAAESHQTPATPSGMQPPPIQSSRQDPASGGRRPDQDILVRGAKHSRGSICPRQRMPRVATGRPFVCSK